MNIDDLKGNVGTEIQPFLKEVRDRFDHDFTHAMGQILIMSVLSKVSPKTGKF